MSRMSQAHKDMQDRKALEKSPAVGAPELNAPDLPTTDPEQQPPFDEGLGLPQLIAKIKASLQGAKEDSDQAHFYRQSETKNYIDAGGWLLQCKEKVPYSEWGSWVKENFPGSTKKVETCMRMANRCRLMPDLKDEIIKLSVNKADKLLAEAFNAVEEAYQGQFKRQNLDRDTLRRELNVHRQALNRTLAVAREWMGEDNWVSYRVGIVSDYVNMEFEEFEGFVELPELPNVPKLKDGGLPSDDYDDDDEEPTVVRFRRGSRYRPRDETESQESDKPNTVRDPVPEKKKTTRVSSNRSMFR